MKKILITGAGSFVGESFKEYAQQFPNDYDIDVVDMLGEEWKNHDFSSYDTVFHVAGIAHSDSGKINKDRQDLYYKVNTDLTIEVAEKAKESGVKQFIFMSSSIVYGQKYRIGKEFKVNSQTQLAPSNVYGDSKAKAEVGIRALDDDSFKVVIVRPPVIYGRGCKGNYSSLVKISKIAKVFPYIKNERSMLYIDNLCEFIRLMIDNYESGTYFPQNAEYVNTSEMIRMIGEATGRRIILIKGFAWLFKIMGMFVGIVNRAFGNFVYDMSMSEYKCDYRVKSLEQSIQEIHG